MLKIRLRRVGKKKQPSYRVVVADSRAPRDGSFVEMVGHYNPLRNPAEIRLDLERVRYWRSQGAQMTDSVADLVRRYEIRSAEEAPAEKPAAAAVVQKKAPAAKVAPSAEAEAAPQAGLAELGLAPRFVSLLEKEGLTTVEQVVERYKEQGPESFTAISGFGPKALKDLEAGLKDRGLIE